MSVALWIQFYELSTLPLIANFRSYSSWSSSSSSSTSGGRSGGGGGASGWVRGEDGTWVRSGRQGSRRRGEGAYGGVEIGSQDALGMESGIIPSLQ